MDCKIDALRPTQVHMKLLIIEDEEDLATALARGLRKQGYAVDVAYDGEEGWELADNQDYDLLILDLSLPSLDGVEICRRLRLSQPRLLILMLTARSHLNERVSGLDTGADDYLVKPFHWSELMARVRALLRRDIRVSGSLLRCHDLTIDADARIAQLSGRRLDLTPKEFGILEYMMRNAGRVITHQELLDHVWDSSADPFSNALRVHINSLRRKLGDHREAPLYIETVVSLGYRMCSIGGTVETK